MTSPTSQPTAERVGRYQLLEPIGSGPSGVVSRAKVFGVAGFERQFAIKRFHSEITGSTTLAQSLSAAARGYGSLEHPRIARMSEFGVAQGTTFTAVEYVAGLDALRLVNEVRLSGGALAAGGALALVSQAARAVGYAHGRGLTHLGLAPTNVIVTADGDIKITDFGILAATLPQRPVDAIRLAHRVQYLAPEQIAGEATSAATDVFALGVLAYELVTGIRAFNGETPQQAAQAVMSGPPPEPPLPRPIVRVLQRCLARSPFERFPDARALADALDAALRVAPVPGTRKDIGAQVKQTIDRLAAMNQGEASGILSLNIVANTPTPARKEPISAIAVLGNKDPRTSGGAGDSSSDMTTVDIAREARKGGGADLKKPMSTVAGLVPPAPIKVPPGVTPPPPSPDNLDRTVLGTPGKPPPPIPTIPAGPAGPAAKPSTPKVPASIKPVRMGEAAANAAAVPTLGPKSAPVATQTPPARPTPMPGVVPPPATPRRPPIISAETKPGIEAPVKIPEGVALPEGELGELDIEIDQPPKPRLFVKPETDPGIGIQPTVPAGDRNQRPTDEMSALMAQKLQVAATKPTRDLDKYLPPAPGTATPAPTSPSKVMAAAEAADLPDELEMSFAETALVTDSKKLEAQTEIDAALDGAFGGNTDPNLGDNLDRTVLGTGAPPRSVVTKPGLGDKRLKPPTGPGLEPPPPSGPPSNEPKLSPSSAAIVKSLQQPKVPIVVPRPEPPMPVQRDGATEQVHVPQKRGGKGLWIVLSLVLLAGLGVGGFFAYKEFLAPKDDAGTGPVASSGDGGVPPPAVDAAVATTTVDAAAGTTPPPAADAADVAATADAADVAAVTDAGATEPVDAQVATVTVDAGTPVTIDAGTLTPQPGGGDSLTITSTPPGARVFLDGADSGVTPLKLPGSNDKHSIALFLPAHELYVAQVDGRGTFAITMKSVTPLDGPAGIKVTRCKDKDRYYVSVDGKPTGQTCPTERIQVGLGQHTVEIYDLQTEKHTEHKVDVTDTRLSYRVKIDP